MKILVIGGSYFYGRVFTLLTAKEHEVTVLNRGTYSVKELGAREIAGDRHDTAVLQSCTEDYDVIVDFCAYEAGDIELVLSHLPGRVKQYVFISTVDVYQRGAVNGAKEMSVEKKTEDTPFELRRISGDAGRYIAGKIALEQELCRACGERGTAYTIFRPSILYGPFNYAPREPLYIRMLLQDGALPLLTDAEGRFQLVYVKDAAEAVCKSLLNEQAYGQAYNLCGDEVVDYESFFRALLSAAGGTVKRPAMTVADAEKQGIPLPFPVRAEESELYSNEKSRRELGMSYLPLTEGMRKTFQAFSGVFRGEA